MLQAAEHNVSEKVMNDVMHLFWEKGFSVTSIDDIVKVSGLNRAAIYKYFGDKEQLYLAMLKRYFNQVTLKLTQPLLTLSDNPICALHTFFKQFKQAMQMPVQDKGCLLVMTATELPLHNDAINQVVHEFLQYLQRSLRALLKQATQQGICDPELDCEQTTSFLLGNIMGLMTLLRTKAPKQLVDQHINAINQYLDSLTSRDSQ